MPSAGNWLYLDNSAIAGMLSAKQKGSIRRPMLPTTAPTSATLNDKSFQTIRSLS